MTEPRTEAGKRLDEEWYPGGGDGLDVSEHAEFTASILAIEAEATAAAEQRLSDFERVAAKARILASYPLVGAEDARQDLIDALRDVWPPNRAWSASPRQGEPVETWEPRIDEAWAAAEAALPEGWVVFGLIGWPGPRVPVGEWRATAVHRGESEDEPFIDAFGPTPEAALRALATRLSTDPAEPVAPDKEGNG